MSNNHVCAYYLIQQTTAIISIPSPIKAAYILNTSLMRWLTQRDEVFINIKKLLPKKKGYFLSKK